LNKEPWSLQVGDSSARNIDWKHRETTDDRWYEFFHELQSGAENWCNQIYPQCTAKQTSKKRSNNK